MTGGRGAPGVERDRGRSAIGVLALSLLGISFAAPLVRLSENSGLVVAVGRLALSLVIVGVMLVATGSWRQWRELRRADFAVALGAGTMLALHFWSWNTSLAFTSVAASVVLVNLQPGFVALLSALWLREPPTRAQVVGIAVAVAGAVVVGATDAGAAGAVGARALFGDLLALGGAATVAVYYVAGRRLRQRMDLWPYVGLVYGACFVVLVAIALALNAPLVPQPRREWLIFAALAVGPMMLGHTGLNWALKHLPAYMVSLTVLGEPIGATLLAAALPGIDETPGVGTVVGGTLILIGALVTARARR